MIAVTDAGPLMALAKIDSLDLLSRLHSQVYLTPSVYVEAVTAGYAGNFISVRRPHPFVLSQFLFIQASVKAWLSHLKYRPMFC